MDAERIMDLVYEVYAGERASEAAPRELQDTAAFWQAAITEADCPAILAEAQKRVEDGDTDNLDEAIRWVGADWHFRSWLKEQERCEREEENAAYERASKINHTIAEFCRAINAALNLSPEESLDPRRDFRSRYGVWRGLTIRVSDHEQPPGGGWHEGLQDQMGTADVSWVVTDPEQPIPTAEEIREAVEAALRERESVEE